MSLASSRLSSLGSYCLSLYAYISTYLNRRYNALAGIADPSNSFFLIPVAHFPWSDKGREARQKVDNSAARNAETV